jgi:hypothetical protein
MSESADTGVVSGDAVGSEAAGGFESSGAALGVNFTSGEVAQPPAEAQAVETPTEAAPAGAGWIESFGVDDRAYIEQKGWSDPSALLSSYRAAEQRIGGDPSNTLQIPDWEDSEQVSQFHSKIGVPEAADGYPHLEIETSRGPLEVGQLAQISHAIGLTPVQHAKLAEMTANLVNDSASQEDASYAARVKAESREIMAENSQSPQEFDAMVQRGIQALGLSPEESRGLTQGVGLKKAVSILQAVSNATQEKTSVSEGDATGIMGTMSQDVARARLKLRREDDQFRKRLFNNETEAVEEWRKLQESASTLE